MRVYAMIAGLVLGLTLGLSLAPDRAAAQSCGSDTHCKGLKEKTRHLKARNPQAEATAAAQAGDYRLGRMFRYGDPVSCATSDLPGLRCRIWPRSLVGKEHVSDDVITPGEDEHAKAVYEFLRRYNRTLVAAPGFPYGDVCSAEEAAPQARYTGPVTTPAQAARSGDIARLEVLNATPEALNAPDELTVTPMGWAVDNDDAAMGLALADRGADPNALGGFDGRAPGLLGLLILKGDYDGARRVRDRGGKLPPDTGLCPDIETLFDLTVLPPEPKESDSIREVGECSWAGLLLRRGQVDLLEHLLKTHLASDDIYGSPEEIDSLGDLYAGFYQAILAGDMALAGRLSPYVVELADDPGFLSIWLYRHGQHEMAADKAQTVARSAVEARLWRRAVDAGHPQVFAQLFDYGLHLNYLTAEQLADCEGAITGGDQESVFTLCIRSSFLRAEGILAAVKSGDIERFRHELDISSGLSEIYKPSLSAMVTRYGTAQMLDELNRRITLPNNWSIGTSPVYDEGRGGHSVPLRRMYDGPLRTEIDAWVMPRMVYPSLPWPSAEPAIARHDLDMVRAMVGHKYPGTMREIHRALNLGNGPEGLVSGYRDVYPDTQDSELYPNAPTPAVMALYADYVPILAEANEPKGLWEIVAHASAMGWNDVIVLAQANGFDAVRDGTPEIWARMLNFNSVCKPSTAALLLKAGLPFPRDNTSRTYGHMLFSAVAVCADAETVRVLVRDAGISVNDDLFGDGTTALDVARQRGRTSIEAVLLELGGKPGKEVWPQTKAQMREGLDPDVWAGED